VGELLSTLEVEEAADVDADASIAAAAVEKDPAGLLDSHMFFQSLLYSLRSRFCMSEQAPVDTDASLVD
jgi:hypothetical protein